MTPAATPEALREALIHACFDPGHVIGPRDGRTMDEWRGDACMKQIAPLLAALATATAEAASLRDEVEGLKGSASSYSVALAAMKLGASCRRQAWKPGKTVRLMTPQAPALSYLAIVYDDGRQAPWTPTRCDQLEDDWLIAQPEREATNV